MAQRGLPSATMVSSAMDIEILDVSDAELSTVQGWSAWREPRCLTRPKVDAQERVTLPASMPSQGQAAEEQTTEVEKTETCDCSQQSRSTSIRKQPLHGWCGRRSNHCVIKSRRVNRPRSAQGASKGMADDSAGHCVPCSFYLKLAFPRSPPELVSNVLRVVRATLADAKLAIADELSQMVKLPNCRRILLAWLLHGFLVVASCSASVALASVMGKERALSTSAIWLIACAFTFAWMEPLFVLLLNCARCALPVVKRQFGPCCKPAISRPLKHVLKPWMRSRHAVVPHAIHQD